MLNLLPRSCISFYQNWRQQNFATHFKASIDLGLPIKQGYLQSSNNIVLFFLLTNVSSLITCVLMNISLAIKYVCIDG